MTDHSLLDGAMLLWWVLTIPSFLFVLVDIFRTTPEATVMKWAFVILTAFSGPVGAFFYVLACREPIKGAHDQYVSVRWRQVVGSTMHCAAGDGVGIVVGAAIGAGLTLSFWPDFALEYILGFSFGWGYFQAFAMKDMAGGDYLKSLRMTFLPEFLSMNMLMSGMLLISKFWMPHVAGADDPTQPEFWFIMSMALLGGFIAAYPMNWWLVANHMKHGMITVLQNEADAVDPANGQGDGEGTAPAHGDAAMAGADTAMAGTGTGTAMAGTGTAMADMGTAMDGGGQADNSDAPMDMPEASTALKLRMIIVSVATLAVTLFIITTFA